MSMPPEQPTEPHPPPRGGPRQSSPFARVRALALRHPRWSTALAVLVVLVIIGAATSQPPPAKTTKTAATTTEHLTTPNAASTPARPALSCHAQATRFRPRDHTTVWIRVRTVGHVKVTAMSPGRSVTALDCRRPGQRPGRAAAAVPDRRRHARGPDRHRRSCLAAGPVGQLPGVAAAPGSTGRESTRAATSADANAGPAPSPAPTRSPAPPPTKASCHPLSDEGTCYEPGEFCRDSDHGVTGLAGDGETITCEDNDGWRWEPS